jgi:hypothetical protein
MSMFCMPISIRGTVIGVVQMMNKIGGDRVLTVEDEETIYWVTSAPAKLYDKRSTR